MQHSSIRVERQGAALRYGRALREAGGEGVLQAATPRGEAKPGVRRLQEEETKIV